MYTYDDVRVIFILKDCIILLSQNVRFHRFVTNSLGTIYFIFFFIEISCEAYFYSRAKLNLPRNPRNAV